MPMIKSSTKETLTKLLLTYYDALKTGELQMLSALMTKESYIITLDVLGFKRAFKEPDFKKLLKQIGDDDVSLQEVQSILSADLAKQAKEHEITLLAFDFKGDDRITVRYTEDGHPKKVYFSSASGEWKIDYKAGRQKI